MKSIEELIRELPDDLQREVRDFVEFLAEKRARKGGHKLRQDWAGALREHRDEYTSVELQKKAQDWRSTLHRMVDMLPTRDLDAADRIVRGLLRVDCDPVLLALLAAPIDDEPVTDEDIAAEAEADSDIAARRLISHEDAKRALLGDE